MFTCSHNKKMHRGAHVEDSLFLARVRANCHERRGAHGEARPAT